MADVMVLKNNDGVINLVIQHVEVSKNHEIPLKTMQDILGGYIQSIRWNENLKRAKIDMWCNEEGKILDLPPTALLADKENKVVDVIAGNILFTGFDSRGNSVPLTDGQVDLIIKELSQMVRLGDEALVMISA